MLASNGKGGYHQLQLCRREIESKHVINLHNAARDGDLKLLNYEVDKIYSEFLDEESRRHALSRKDAHHMTPLLYAVKYNNINAIRFLVEKRSDVNGKGRDGSTPLHYATRFISGEDDHEILDYLISNNANVNAGDDLGCTPLHYACSRGNVNAGKALLNAAGINVHALNHHLSSPLHDACAFGSIELVDLLLENGADILVQNEAKMTPFLIACSSGHLELVKHLLKLFEESHGMVSIPRMISHKSIEGQSPLHLAVLGSYSHITKLLLDKGADINQLMDECETVLHISAVTGNKKIINMVLDHGINMNRENVDGRTALHKAAKFGKHEVVNILIQRGAYINCMDYKWITPLMLASSSSGNAETVQVLLDNNADITIRDKECRTTLHMAVMDNNKDVVRTLLDSPQCKKIINWLDKDSNSSLHVACAHGFEEIAIMLLAAGADPRKRNYEEKTPLHLAAFYGQNDVVDEIIDINPSSVNEFDQEGNSALHMASLNGFADVIQYLLKCGAAVNDKNMQSMSALDCAAENGETKAVEVLLWAGASVSPAGESEWSPLHRSARAGHAKTTELLLMYCDVSLTDIDGKNPLDLAIENHHKDVVMIFINHRDWQQALRNWSLEPDNSFTNPMRKMVANMPDIAYYTFTRCITESKEYPSDHTDYCINVDFEFLRDVQSDWPCDIVRRSCSKGTCSEEILTQEDIQEELYDTKHHLLSLMVKQKRKSLVMHPLCRALTKMKWSRFASYIYYMKLFVYTMFLIFLTGFILVAAPLKRDSHCKYKSNKNDWTHVTFLILGRVVVVVLTAINLFLEIMQLVTLRLSYLKLTNLFDWIVYVLAIINVADHSLNFLNVSPRPKGNDLVALHAPNPFSCSVYQKSIAAMTVFFAWINFILYIRKVSMFGIYIVMFIYVLKTFLKFFIVFTFLLVAFAFSFFVLLHDKQEVVAAFANPIRSIVKTIMMMTGELDFSDSFFQGPHHVKTATIWILFVLFVLIMNIVLMNLLVGLAVDDIQSVQEHAEFTTTTMKIDVCLHAENRLPKMVRKKFFLKALQLYPNRRDGIPRVIRESNIVQEIQKLLLKEQVEKIDIMQENLKRLQDGLQYLEKKVVKIDDHMGALSNISTKIGEIQEMFRKSQEAK